MEQNIRLDVNHMMADMLGAEYGITSEQLAAMREAAVSAQHAVEQNRGKGWLGWMELPYNQEEIVSEIERVAAYVRAHYEYFVVLGIGGSALGPIAVHQALNHLHYNELPADKRPGPKFYVEDNIDPERMAALFDVIELPKTCFCIITKSGATAETMSQYLIISELLKKEVGEGWAEHIIATTDREKGNLIKLARENGFELFHIPASVGGRFSELCPVGLLPAAVCGIDIREMLAGAAAMDERCKTDDVWQNPALLEAVLQYIAMQEMDVNVQVVMPYADSLKYMADWFCQLWAESLGKNVTIGQLLFFFEMTTAYAGELLDIDAFNQPGVEESKIASYAVLGNQNEKYLKKAEEMKGRPASKDEYIL